MMSFFDSPSAVRRSEQQRRGVVLHRPGQQEPPQPLTHVHRPAHRGPGELHQLIAGHSLTGRRADTEGNRTLEPG